MCKFVGNRWFSIQDLILKLENIESDFKELNIWINNKSIHLDSLIKKASNLVKRNGLNLQLESGLEKTDFEDEQLCSNFQLIKVLKEIESEMQSMHSKLNDMNEIGEQISSQFNNSELSTNISKKMDILESQWNVLLEQMEYLSKICTEQQKFENKIENIINSQNNINENRNDLNSVKKRRFVDSEEEYIIVVDEFSKSLESANIMIERHAQLNYDEKENFLMVSSF